MLNKVILIGRLATDPELKVHPQWGGCHLFPHRGGPALPRTKAARRRPTSLTSLPGASRRSSRPTT